MLWLAGEVVNCVLAALLAGLHYPLESQPLNPAEQESGLAAVCCKGCVEEWIVQELCAANNANVSLEESKNLGGREA